ncbi:MAG: hypothetical protein EOM90_07605 [Alphaproteobacteria bacterium]|nr:hypothetical protein [Alphaproteobacteria bacterium]
MKINLSYLGPLRQAEFETNDLTIICGRNNTGKTYATYAFFGFLSYWNEAFTLDVPKHNITELLSEGTTKISISSYIDNYKEILLKACKAYTERLPMVFASSEKYFVNTSFQIELEKQNIKPLINFNRTMGAAKSQLLSISKEPEQNEVIVSLLVNKVNLKVPEDIIGQIIGTALRDIIFRNSLPNPFIASAERTGAAIFRKELNFARNRLLEEVSVMDKEINPFELLSKVYADYALPVKKNVDFTRQLEEYSKRDSYIVKNHPTLLDSFSDIIGGGYIVTKNDELFFQPKVNPRLKLTMDESSSSVRSLLDIGFYLRHVAKQGDLLIVDEPELNLHPENQRRLARLFVRLTKIGIKVFITTHSDYIIKELNTLIMLNQEKPCLKSIIEKEKYLEDELLSADKIKVFLACQDLIRIDGHKRKSLCQTLSKAPILAETGIEVPTFDETIVDMNRIQEEIIWGGE